MEGELINIAATQGVWAVLSFFLIFYIVKTQEKRDLRQEEREKNYQSIITKLTEQFDIIDSIHSNVESIKNKLNL